LSVADSSQKIIPIGNGQSVMIPRAAGESIQPSMYASRYRMGLVFTTYHMSGAPGHF